MEHSIPSLRHAVASNPRNTTWHTCLAHNLIPHRKRITFQYHCCTLPRTTAYSNTVRHCATQHRTPWYWEGYLGLPAAGARRAATPWYRAGSCGIMPSAQHTCAAWRQSAQGAEPTGQREQHAECTVVQQTRRAQPHLATHTGAALDTARRR